MTESGLSLRWCKVSMVRTLLARGSLTTVLLFLGLALVVAPASGQTGTVNGRVVAASSGDPIALAQVSIVGTNLGTRTDENGEFVLVNVPVGQQQIMVAQIGYQVGTLQLTVAAGITTADTVRLTKTVLRLDEVVVTGTAGQARRREVGNSIAQLEIADEVEPPPSVEMLLAGRAAGVNVTQGGGAAGTGGQIRLRGTVSVSQSNLPIIYIDGVRTRSEGYYRNRPVSDYTGRGANVQASPLNDINPADIERIEIIKGSAASTLYGTEASAGVIQIFTKKGRTGSPSWTFQMDQGFAQERPFGTALNPYLNLEPGDYADSTFLIPANLQYATDAADSARYLSGTLGGGSCADLDPNQDCSWLRRGYRSRYSGSVGGGFGPMSYFVSGAYHKYDGVLPNDTENKVSTRGNFTFDVRDNVTIDFNTQFSRTRIENTAQGNNAHGLTLNVYRMERNYFQSNDPRDLRALLNQEISTDINRLVTGFTVNYTPWPWFTNRYTLGYDMAHQENRNLRPYGFVRAPTGRIGEDQILYQTLTSDYVGSMNYTLMPSLRGTFSVGGQYIMQRNVRTSTFGQDFAGPGVPTVSDAALYYAAEDRLKTVNAGFFFQNVFDVNNNLFITAGLRVDGNSAFGKALGLQAYPKLSLSYVISDAAFWPVSLGELKLRAAAGYSGRAPDQFDAIRTWNSEPSGGLPGYEPSNVGNDEVGPERTREIEFGFDGGFLNQRLSVEFTWYEQKTTDALFDVRQIPSLGQWNAQAANVGSIRNRGIELGVTGIVFDTPDWGFDVGVNLYTNKSIVLSLGDTLTGDYAVPFSTQGGWVEEGWPVIAARGYMITNPDEIADPVIVQDTIFGPSQPTFVFNPSVNLRFPHGIQLSARGEYQGGAWYHDGASFNALSRSVRWPTCTESRGDPGASAYALISDGREDELTAWERAMCIPGNTDTRSFYFKKDFFKLRDVTLTVPVGWVLPQVRSASLSLTAQNWIRWKNSDFRIFDPEMGDRDNINDQGVTSIAEHIAPPAVFVASLRINF